MTVAVIKAFPSWSHYQMGAFKLPHNHSLFPTVFLCDPPALNPPLPSKFSPGEVITEPLTPLFPQVTEEVDYLSFITAVLWHKLRSPLAAPAASCYLTAWSAAKLIPHHNRSQLQVICHRRDSNPIMCTRKTLNHAQAHTDVPELCMRRC